MKFSWKFKFNKKNLCFLLMAAALFVTTAVHTEDAEARRRNRRVKHTAKKGGGGGGRNAKRDAATPSGVYALYENESFGYAKCLPAPTEGADAILNRNGIQTKNAKPIEKEALAKGIAQVERLLGDPIPAPWRINFRWKNEGGPWNSGKREPGWVHIKTAVSPTHGQLTGRMMHELGHKIGYANEGKNYQAYTKHMNGKQCHISGYTFDSRNEQFADVFEAYVVNPAFLEQNCKEAYSFFKDELFKSDKTRLASCSDPESVLHAGRVAADDDEEEHDHDHEEDAVNAQANANEDSDVDAEANDVNEKSYRVPRIATVPVPMSAPLKQYNERVLPDGKVSGVQ